MTNRTARPSHRAALLTGALSLCATLLVILAALAFEHVGGYAPCPLCLQQRYAYYLGIPLLSLALVALWVNRGRIAAPVFGIVAALFLINAGLGLYHAGAEWKFWPGPATCATTAPLNTNAQDLLKDLARTRVVRCDEAPWRLLGLSFAGWNVLASLAVAVGAASSAWMAGRR